MRQQKLCPDKQQYNNAFPVHVVTSQSSQLSVGILCETGGIMGQQKLCPDKQQYNNAKVFLVRVVAIDLEEIENYY